MGKASAAVAGGALLATGLIGVGSPAFANTGGADSTPDPAPQPTEHKTEANAPQDKDLVGVNAPVALDLHKGVANDLNVSDVARDVAVVGDVVPAEPAAQGEHGKHAKSTDGKESGNSHVAANAGEPGKPGDAAKPIGEVAGKAQATVGDVGHAVGQPVSGVVTSVDQTVHSAVQSTGIGPAR